MNFLEFCEKYNLRETIFADLAGVSVPTLHKYIDSVPISERSMKKIEKAIRITKKYNLVHPAYWRGGDPYSFEYDECIFNVRLYRFEFGYLMKIEP